jgi:hypothetical protein
MDDFTLASLQESKNEWCARLVNILTPLIIEGFGSIYNEAYSLCEKNEERSKYLMTFQNFIARVPKWNATIIKDESNRIIERSGCNYLEDLISCVHIIQLKVLTCMRVGQEQKKVDINIPKLDDFIHKCYINCARKIYSNVYLYENNIPPLLKQKNNRELELIVQDNILTSIRDSLPIESILKNYMDETVEEVISEHIEEEKIAVPAENKEIKEDKEVINEESKKVIDDLVSKESEKEETPVDSGEPSKELDVSMPLMKIETDISETIEPSLTEQEVSPHISFNSENTILDGNDETHTEDFNDGILKIEDGDISLDTLDVHDISKDLSINNDPIELEIEEL